MIVCLKLWNPVCQHGDHIALSAAGQDGSRWAREQYRGVADGDGNGLKPGKRGDIVFTKYSLVSDNHYMWFYVLVDGNLRSLFIRHLEAICFSDAKNGDAILNHTSIVVPDSCSTPHARFHVFFETPCCILSPWRSGNINHGVISCDRYDCRYHAVRGFQVFDENQRGTRVLIVGRCKFHMDGKHRDLRFWRSWNVEVTCQIGSMIKLPIVDDLCCFGAWAACQTDESSRGTHWWNWEVIMSRELCDELEVNCNVFTGRVSLPGWFSGLFSSDYYRIQLHYFRILYVMLSLTRFVFVVSVVSSGLCFRFHIIVH